MNFIIIIIGGLSGIIGTLAPSLKEKKPIPKISYLLIVLICLTLTLSLVRECKIEKKITEQAKKADSLASNIGKSVTKLDSLGAQYNLLKNQNDSLNSNMHKILTQLNPFIEAAEEQFPGYNQETALEKLRYKLERIEQKTGLPYKSPNKVISDVVLRNLLVLRKKYGKDCPFVRIRIESNSQLDDVASQLSEFLIKANLEVGPIERITNGGTPGIALSGGSSNKNNREFFEDFVKAIEPYLSGSSFFNKLISIGQPTGPGSLDIILAGTGVYGEKGEVRIEASH